MPRKQKIKGITRFRDKWRGRVEVAGQPPVTKLFALDTPPDEMQQWYDETKKELKGNVPNAETLAADVDTYLARDLVKAKPTYERMTRHLRWWVVQLHGTTRTARSVTEADVSDVLEKALTTPTVMPTDPEKRRVWRGRPSAKTGLKPGTVRVRRTSLQSFFTWKNGKKGFNPARGALAHELKQKKARDLPALGVDYGLVEQIISAMPVYRDTKKDSKTKKVLAPELSLAPIRARVIAYTSLPPGQIKKLRPYHLFKINGKHPMYHVPERMKGAGVAEHDEQLSLRGVAALKAFHDANAYDDPAQPFSISSINRSFKKAAKRVGYDRPINLYALRHSFGTQAYRDTGDMATVNRLMGLAEGSTVSARYSRGAHADVDAAALRAFDASVDEAIRNAITTAPAPKLTRGQKAAARKPAARSTSRAAAKLTRVK